MGKAIASFGSAPMLEALTALGIGELNNVHRVVIDVTSGEPVKLYVEHYGDEKVIGVFGALTTVEVERG